MNERRSIESAAGGERVREGGQGGTRGGGGGRGGKKLPKTPIKNIDKNAPAFSFPENFLFGNC